MKNKKAKKIRLYDFNPAFMVLLLTPLGFVPVIGYFIVNFIFSVIAVCIVHKRFKIKNILISTGISYSISLSVLYLGVLVCCFVGGFIFMCVFGANATYDGRVYPHIVEIFMTVFWFVIGLNCIFAVSFFLTSKQIIGKAKCKLRTRVIIAVILTLLNAPYLLFIPYEQAVYVDYNKYYKYVDETAHEEQKAWKSDDGNLEFKTTESFHRFYPSGDEINLMNFHYDNAADSDISFSIDFDDWVSNNGGYYNQGGYHVYYSKPTDNNLNYVPLFSGHYHRNNSNELVFEVQTVNNVDIKTPYKTGDTIILHAN